jgi:hypothetical protein
VVERASGLSEKRRGLHRLFRLAAAGETDVVVAEFRDRLARFGFGYIMEARQARGVRGEVLDGPVAVDVAQELVADMLAIVTWFAARLYGRWSRQFRRKVKEAAKEAGLAGHTESACRPPVPSACASPRAPTPVKASAATVAEWGRAAPCCTRLFPDHPDVFEAKQSGVRRPEAGPTKEVAATDKDRLTWAESVADGRWRFAGGLGCSASRPPASGSGPCWGKRVSCGVEPLGPRAGTHGLPGTSREGGSAVARETAPGPPW